MYLFYYIEFNIIKPPFLEDVEYNLIVKVKKPSAIQLRIRGRAYT